MSEMNHTHHEHNEQEIAAKKAARPQIEIDNRYWRSLDQYNNDPKFLESLETEFMSSPLREEDGQDGFARREFLKLMGASLAMATAGCIRRPVQKIVPYNKMPEEVTIGVPNFYTSTFFDGSEGLGLLVKTREGRPIKIEGNPSHPLNKGATSARAQASILNLYDPERLKAPQKNIFNEKRTNKDTVSVKWDDLDSEVVAQLKKGGVTLLTGAIVSPSTRALINDFVQAYKVDHLDWEPLSYEEIREGQKAAYGDDLVPQYRFDKAKMIISVDADFLGSWLTPVTFNRQFAASRKNIDKMSKFVMFDSNYSLSGANADIRVKIKPSQQLDVVMGLLHEIIVVMGKSSYAGNASVKAQLANYAGVATKLGVEVALFKKIAEDLWQNKGQSLVVAGGLPTKTAVAKELQVAVNFLNSALENDGKTIEGKNGNPGLKGSSVNMGALIEDMNAGRVKTLIIHRSNPVYALPKEAGFVEALSKVGMVIYTGDRMDETGRFAHLIAADNHPLESWGDAEFSKDVYSIQQPAIRPMYDTRSFQLSMLTWMKSVKAGSKRVQSSETFYDYVRAFWKEEIAPKFAKGKSFDDFWLMALHEGVVGDLQKSSAARSFKLDAFTSMKPAAFGSDLELVLYPTVQLGDGSMSNISWLMELPDPVTKITWDNYASFSLATADKHKLAEGDIVELTVGTQKLELPVHIQPGLHDGVVAVAVGYGRTNVGKLGNGVGQNAYALSQFKGKSLYSGFAVELKKTGKTDKLACVQSHHSMEGRQIVVEATLAEYLKKKDANIHKHHTWSIWSGHQYNGHKWGMAIDLNSCTGCSACVTACQSENNIPVVGKKYVLQNREMHWIRIDRYYTGTPDNPQVVFQPLMCQHCDNAPCETVCPVAATVHSDEGLNDMVYNRCVGTRYCSNNCPYKVRRFNWFNYMDKTVGTQNMAHNPDVTVRMRGVMEKCTFCVQRIKEGKNKAKLENRSLKDGEIKTACQTSCPTDAIVFGDMNDPESQVSKMFKDERAYTLLEEWHAAPAVRYLSKIRNNGKETMGQGGHV